MRAGIVSFSLAAAACTHTTHNGDIVGPFDGAPHRYIVDRFQLPTNNTQARQLGDDLTGKGTIANQAGMVIGTLNGMGFSAAHPTDMITSGALMSSIVIQADDLTNDPHVGVAYYGADGDAATAMGGTLVNGVFASNRTRRTSVPGAATIRLPLLADADPTQLELAAMEIDLAPDGNGGYDGLVRGGLTGNYLAAAAASLVQMIETNPQAHRTAVVLLGGYNLTVDTVLHSGWLESLLAPDVTLFGQTVVSIGFGIHLLPCPAGDCALNTAASSCFDRTVNGTETDVDCGGSCLACPGGGACRVPGDCQSGSCVGGTCAAPTCSDGVQDGFENGVDCGGPCPRAC